MDWCLPNTKNDNLRGYVKKSKVHFSQLYGYINERGVKNEWRYKKNIKNSPKYGNSATRKYPKTRTNFSANKKTKLTGIEIAGFKYTKNAL